MLPTDDYRLPTDNHMHLLFDLDGTLTDPKTGIVNCFRYALEKLGLESPADHELERHIGPPIFNTFHALLNTTDRSVVDQAVAYYRGRFSAKGLYENIIYDGIPETLERLCSAGATLHLATSKPTIYATQILEHFGIREFFRGLYGSELDGTRGDKKELIAWILERENLHPEECAMIGDREYDAIGALANGVQPHGVLWGYGSEQELRAAGCVALHTRPHDLQAIISEQTAE